MTTPNFTQDVPQWIESASWQCITALLMLKNQSLTDDDVRGLHAAFHGFIAKHAPQPEAKEVAVLESMLANEEQACMEALEERDTAIGFCDLFAATILGEDINWSCHETKWQEALDMMSNGKTIEVSGIMLRRSGDHAIVEAEVDGKWKEVIREYIDAPFSHIVEPAGIADAKESELNSVPDGVEATPTTAATDAASGVERFIVNNNSVRYACTKLAAVGDKVKVIGSNPPLHMNVEEISPTGGLYIKSPTGAWCMLLNSSQVEFVPEVTPAHPVCRGCNQPLKAENAWMSDGCPCNNPRGINHGLVPKEVCTCEECAKPDHIVDANKMIEPATDFDFDEAASKAAAVIKGRLDSDTLTVSADMLSDSISAQIRPGVQELYKKLQHRRCDTCGANTIDGCPRCGAPQCCPQCCIISTHEHNATILKERLAVAMSLLAQCGARMFMFGDYEARLKDGKWSLQKYVMGSWVYQGEFTDPVQAALRAKELADVGKVGAT